MAELQSLLPRKIPAGTLGTIAAFNATNPDVGAPPSLPDVTDMFGTGKLPVVPLPTPTNVSTNPLIDRKADLEADLQRRSNPIAPTTTLGKIGHVAAKVGNVLGDIFAPDAMANIPGTQLYNERIRNRDQDELARISQEQTADDQRKKIEADTAYSQARPDIEQSKIDQRQAATLQRLTGTLARAGQKITGFDEHGVPIVEDDPELQAFDAQAAHMTHEQAAAALDNLRATAGTPGTPLYEQNQRKIAVLEKQAQARMQYAQFAGTNAAAHMMSAQTGRMNYMAGNYGTGIDGEPLAGTMIADDGRTVGSHQAQNVRPTGQERSKADMAYSAEEQLSDIKGIMQKHPTLFGPGYGQASAFRQWLGSQDPDAQRFIAARTIAGDHLAGTFGGRSEAALDALDKAIGQFKDNPAAAVAGIDQLTKANTRFEKAGTVRTNGSSAAPKVKRYNAATGRLE